MFLRYNTTIPIQIQTLSAAANHVRQCVQEILTHAGIDIRDANDRFITLNDRIKI